MATHGPNESEDYRFVGGPYDGQTRPVPFSYGMVVTVARPVTVADWRAEFWTHATHGFTPSTGHYELVERERLALWAGWDDEPRPDWIRERSREYADHPSARWTDDEWLRQMRTSFRYSYGSYGRCQPAPPSTYKITEA